MPTFVEKTDWEDDPSTTSPITAAELLRMEAGIAEGVRSASESQAGNVELASAAEMNAGTDLTRPPSVKRVADYVAAQISSVTGTSAATETAAGIVELASSAEMTAGTDLTRPPSVKRVADYVAAAITAATPNASETVKGLVELANATEMTAGTDTGRVPTVKLVADYVAAEISGLGGGGSVSAATETAAGIVELATAAELTTGTDLTRVPSVKRVVDYIESVTDAIYLELADKPDITGSVNQFADVSNTTPAVSDVFRWNGGAWAPSALDSLYAEIGVDGRIVSTAEPQYYVPILVINEGDTVPSTFPSGGVVLSRPTTTSFVPASIGTGQSSASTTVTATTTSDLAVGDYLYVAWAASYTTASGISNISSVTVNAGAIGTFTEFGSGDSKEGTVQTKHGFARVTTTIPSGSVVTLTGSVTRPSNFLVLAKVQGIVSSSANDSGGSLGGNGATNSTLAKSFGGLNTANANDIAFMAFGYNKGNAGTNSRSTAGTNGWTALGSSSADAARACDAYYKVLTTTQSGLAGTVQFTSEDGTSGAWAGVLGALRKA